MPEKQWWYAEGGVSHGPIPEPDLVAGLRSGGIALSVLVWQRDMPRWEPALGVPVLAALLPGTPALSRPEAVAPAPPLPLPTSPVLIYATPFKTASRAIHARPWHRWFGRSLDYTFLTLVLGSAHVLGSARLIPVPTTPVLTNPYALAWVAAIVWIPMEAILLATVGTTPGKYLVGLRVRGKAGGRLGLLKAFRRAIAVWVVGCALLIPVVCLVTFVIQYRRLKAGRDATWDERGGVAVPHAPLSVGRRVLLIGVVVVSLVLVIALLLLLADVAAMAP